MRNAAAHRELPRSDTARPSPRYLLYSPLRPLARWVLRRRYVVRVSGASHVPSGEGVIFASNHVGIIDGPVLAIFGPRPVHALTKIEMFRGLLGWCLLKTGQIPLDRFHTDPAAVRTCLRVLRNGGAIGIYPEGGRGAGDLQRFHRGAAYLALVSGATIVPVTMIGSREPGGHVNSLPRPGATIDMIFGEPFHLGAVAWPRTREHVEKASLLLREHMLVQLERALAATGRELPGPLPGTDVDPDPATGVTDEGAP